MHASMYWKEVYVLSVPKLLHVNLKISDTTNNLAEPSFPHFSVTDKVIRQGTHVYEFCLTIPTGYSNIYYPNVLFTLWLFYKLH